MYGWTFLMKKLLSHGVGQEAAETLHGIGRRLINLEESFRPRKFEHYSRVGRDRSQLQISIPLVHFRHATQQHFHSGSIELPDLRKVKDNLGAISD